MQAFVTGFVDFVSANREWAPLLVFLLALGETIAFVSILIPSTAILVGIGALVAAGALDFWPLFVGAAAGALVGSSFSYWLGLRYGPVVLGLWPLSRDPALVARGTESFARWGAGAVLIGHFFGPLRAVAFVTAGVATMPALVFQLANVPGAIAWAFLIPKTGEIGGDAIWAAWQALAGT